MALSECYWAVRHCTITVTHFFQCHCRPYKKWVTRMNSWSADDLSLGLSSSSWSRHWIDNWRVGVPCPETIRRSGWARNSWPQTQTVSLDKWSEGGFSRISLKKRDRFKLLFCSLLLAVSRIVVDLNAPQRSDPIRSFSSLFFFCWRTITVSLVGQLPGTSQFQLIVA